ncbi:DUF4270 family protein [Parabacteroides gordonii]|mgnify:FL=1|uniref:DUF4270 domain-containing protein n=1 Tax=Parabacteroides gordonii MS-1 = DSM 23371 TaxID=1203610 RepID=A0A0F5JLY4_9BACT|nr:DUF4270 family protein [Parabacteroides gordonii]KKB58793.1 hypothetical protein HMPREF1536_00996 [Parabacteroides gordonii MS-1 = DSM 23371]MCA5583604.1 DUF4270 domain-containing protein [Parabacteroides gordonii]
MNKILFLFWICLSGCLLSSCYDESNKYGNGLVDSVFRNISTDTSTVVITSVLIDSLETSGTGVALIGEYTHSLWGTMKSTGYIPYTRPTYSTDISKTVVLDSLILSLSYGSYCLGDTLQYQQFSVYQLTEKVLLNDNGYLYNTSSFTYDPTPIGSCRFKPRPLAGNRLEIRLPDELGQNLLTRFHERDEAVSSERFENYFKGVVIVPDNPDSHSILSFQLADTMSTMVLHYHIIGEESNEQELVFAPNTSTHFSHIDHDRSGTLMEPYPAKDVEIPSKALDNRGVLFGGLGWFTRLEFPHLNNIMKLGERVVIESAMLKLYPELGTYSDINALPDSIYLYIADENNVVTDAVKDYLGSEVQGGTLVKDNVYNENTYYYFDVTDFMQQELGTIGINKHNLQLVLNEDSYTQTFKNMTFGDRQSKSPIVLQLIYKIYESY